MKKKSAKKETVKEKPSGKKSAKKKQEEEKVQSAKCPDCGYENPIDTIYCGQCANMIIMKRYDREPPSEPGLEPSPELVEGLEEEPDDKTETTESTAEKLTAGTTFAGRYQITEELDEGSIGPVYKAFDPERDEKVAIKIIRPEIAADEKEIKRFKKELKTVSQISHKNVCRMYHVGTKKGTRYITMEYVSGENLKSSMKRMGQFTVGKAIFTAKQICEGLAEAHKLGIVHGDLNPHNIRIDEFGNVRIMNFGIARSLNKEDGTRAYMSPEQAEAKDIDQRSDIFSLGLILYEMLANRLPFDKDIPLSIATEHMDGPLKGPKEYNPEVPEDLHWLVLKCIKEEKESRYQSAEELLSDLAKIEGGDSVVERVVPESIPSPPKEVKAKFDLKKLLIPVGIAAAVLIIGILIWQLFLTVRVSIPEGKPSLAIMHFENNTGDASLSHLGEVIADSFAADLNQSKYIDVLSSERLFQILSELNQTEARTYSTDVLQQVASRAGINHILLGDFAKTGETIRINVNLLDVRRDKIVATESDEGKGVESIFAMVDGLTKKVKRHFDLTRDEISGDLGREVAQITTSSPEAFKYFVEGKKHHLKGEFRQSIDQVEKAVAMDPEFAMAYRLLSASYGSLGFSAESREFIQKAMELGDRLSEKELYQIQGDFFRVSEETYDQAIEAYTNLLALYPDDTTASQNLALIYYSIEELDRAQEYFELGLKEETEFISTFLSIADIRMMKGEYDRAEEILRYYLENVSNHSWIHQFLVFNYICRGQIHIAQAALDVAIPLAPTNRRSYYLKGVYQTLTESFIEAEKEFQKALKDEEPAGSYLGYHGLANLYITQGRIRDAIAQLRRIIDIFQKLGDQAAESQARSILGYHLTTSMRYQEALREFNRARDLGAQISRQDLQRLALHYKGLAYIRMRSRSRAQQTAEELKKVIEGGSHQKEIRRYHHLMGMIELDRKRYSQAIDHLETALALLPSECSQWTDGHILNNHSLYLDSLALAFYRSGDLQRAIEQYEKITALSTGRLYFGDIYARSFYTLGRIYQQSKQNQKAENNYNKFIALWLNADAGISEVSDAQKRLSGLNR